MVILAVEAGHFSFSINFWLVQTYMTRFEPITVIRRYIPTGTLFLFSPLFHIINLHVAFEYEWIKKYFINCLVHWVRSPFNFSLTHSLGWSFPCSHSFCRLLVKIARKFAYILLIKYSIKLRASLTGTESVICDNHCDGRWTPENIYTLINDCIKIEGNENADRPGNTSNTLVIFRK